MEIGIAQLPPGDPKLVDAIVGQLKSKGIFDRLRKECLEDVDTKPAFLNLKLRVDGQVKRFLETKTWKSDLNKNHLRDDVRKNIQKSSFLDSGIDAIINQVVNPKIKPLILPYVEDTVYGFLQIEKPKREIKEYGAPLPVYSELAPPFLQENPASIDLKNDDSGIPSLEKNEEFAFPANKMDSVSSSDSFISVGGGKSPIDLNQQVVAVHSEVLPMQTDVISSEEDDILAQSPAKTNSQEVKMEEDNALDGFAIVSASADTVISAVEKLNLKDDSNVGSDTKGKSSLPAAPLFDNRSLDSISSNSSGLSFSPLSAKRNSTVKIPSIHSSMSEQSTPLIDERSLSSQESSENSIHWDSSLPKNSSDNRITIASFGNFNTERDPIVGGASPVSTDLSRDTLEKSSVETTVDSSASTEESQERKSEGEVSSSSFSTPEPPKESVAVELSLKDKSENSSKHEHKHRRSSDRDHYRDSSKSRRSSGNEKHRSKGHKHSKSKHDDHSSHRDKDKKYHRHDKDDDKDRDKHSSRSHHSNSHGSSINKASSSGDSKDRRDKSSDHHRHKSRSDKHDSHKHSSRRDSTSHHRHRSRTPKNKHVSDKINKDDIKNLKELKSESGMPKESKTVNGVLKYPKSCEKKKIIAVIKEDSTFMKHLSNKKKAEVPKLSQELSSPKLQPPSKNNSSPKSISISKALPAPNVNVDRSESNIIQESKLVPTLHKKEIKKMETLQEKDVFKNTKTNVSALKSSINLKQKMNRRKVLSESSSSSSDGNSSSESDSISESSEESSDEDDKPLIGIKSKQKNLGFVPKTTAIVTTVSSDEDSSSQSKITLKQVTIPIFSPTKPSHPQSEKRKKRFRNLNNKSTLIKKEIHTKSQLIPYLKTIFPETESDESDFEGFLSPKRRSLRNIRSTLPKNNNLTLPIKRTRIKASLPSLKRNKMTKVKAVAISRPVKRNHVQLTNLDSVEMPMKLMEIEISDTESSDMELPIIQFCESIKDNDFEGFMEFASDQKLKTYLSNCSINPEEVESMDEREESFSTTFFPCIKNQPSDNAVLDKFSSTIGTKADNLSQQLDLDTGSKVFSNYKCDGIMMTPQSICGNSMECENNKICSSVSEDCQQACENLSVTKRRVSETNSDCCTPVGPISKKRRILNAVQSELQENLAKDKLPVVNSSYSLLTPDDDRTSNKEYEVNLERGTSYSPLSPASNSSAEDVKLQPNNAAPTTEVSPQNSVDET